MYFNEWSGTVLNTGEKRKSGTVTNYERRKSPQAAYTRSVTQIKALVLSLRAEHTRFRESKKQTEHKRNANAVAAVFS